MRNVYQCFVSPYESGLTATFQRRAHTRNDMHVTANKTITPIRGKLVLRRGRQLITAQVKAAMNAIREYVPTVRPKIVNSRIMLSLTP